MDVLENINQTTMGGGKYDWGWQQGQYQAVAKILVRRREGVKRPKPQVLDPTPYLLKVDDLETPRGKVLSIEKWAGGQTRTEYEGTLGSNETGAQYGLASRIDETDIDLAELSYIYALAKLNQRDLDLGQALAEAGKTAEMIGELAQVSVESIRAIRRRDVTRLLDVLGLRTPRMRGKGVVDAHLTYTWGIRPMLSDIKGATDALLRLPPESWRVSARSRKERTLEWDTAFPAPVKAHTTLTCRGHTVITATQRPLSKTEDLKWSLGLDSGFSTLWEFAPFSDVVDYLVPIGTYLEACNSLQYYKDWSISSTMINREVITFSGSTRDYGSAAKTATLSGTWKRDRMRRTVSNGPKLPDLRQLSRNPSFRNMATALSLFAGMASGHTPRYLRVF